MSNYAWHAQRLIKKHCEWRHYDGQNYLCWNVKMGGSGYIFDAAFDRMAKEYFHGKADALVCVPNVEALRAQWQSESDALDQLVIEAMRELFRDGDTMRCCSPNTYRRFSYKPAEIELWDVKYEFVGRSSGWLALVKFEGHDMNPDYMSDYEASYWGDEATYHRWYQKLCCMLAEITHMVSLRHREYIYQHAFHLHRMVTGED